MREIGMEVAKRYTWPCVREHLFATYGRVLGRSIAVAQDSQQEKLDANE